MGTVVPNVGSAIRSVDFKGLGDKLQDAHLVQIARWCPNLVSCNVSGTAVTEKGAEYLFGRVNRHSQVLQVLRDGVSKSRTPSNQPVSAPSTGSAQTTPPPPQHEASVADLGVQEYRVNESHRENEYELRERQIVDSITRSLSLLLPSARQMNLSDTSTNSKIPDEDPNAFIPRCPHLECVYLNLARPVGDATISKLARSSKFLKLLDLSSYTSTSQVGDDGVHTVVEMCPGIEVLLLEGASRLTDDALMSLGGWKKTGVSSRNMRDMWKKMSGFESRLRILKLTGCFQVTDFGVRSILSGCTDLSVLSLGYCWRVSDAAFSQDTFSKANLLNEYIRGFDLGTVSVLISLASLKRLTTESNLLIKCCAAGVMLAFFFRTIPAKTAIAALLVYLFLLIIAVGTFLADYLLITDCYLRVKLIYTSVLLHNLSFWVFQADLTHTVTAGISSSVPGTKYIILGTLLYQCTEACYVVYRYEPKVDLNGVCQVTLDPRIFMLDKVSEVVFSMIVAGLFLHPLFLGARDLEAMASSSSKTPHRKDSTTTRNISAPASTHAVHLGPLVAGKHRLMRIIRHRGFILVLSMLVKAINIRASVDPYNLECILHVRVHAINDDPYLFNIRNIASEIYKTRLHHQN
ncbi:hypothetical protein HDU81_008518 [Chytriomyces hyalinus]|nr:hypothetical protein HDU81_008518 [Chytriomyces hyalinus]